MGNTIRKIVFSFFITLLFLIIFIVGCSKNRYGGNYAAEMNKQNPLYSLDEVRELNANLEAPLRFGMSENEVKKAGFEAIENGIEHHIMTYRSKNAQDIISTLGTRELHYGEANTSTQLYVTALRIIPAKKNIRKNDDGSSTPVYSTDRSVFGVKLGDNIEDARKKLASFGYEKVFEEEFSGGLPKTLDNTYKKGAVMITVGCESGQGDISQINIWIPYDDPEINKLNEISHLPVDLGNMYSIIGNPDFKYVQNSKTNVTRTYGSEDGCIAIMRGFPDYKDMLMSAEVSFSSDKYDVLGIKCGMNEADAKQMLLKAGCSEDESGYFIFNSVAAVRLTSENGIIASISACLRPSTNLSSIEIKSNN